MREKVVKTRENITRNPSRAYPSLKREGGKAEETTEKNYKTRGWKSIRLRLLLLLRPAWFLYRPQLEKGYMP